MNMKLLLALGCSVLFLPSSFAAEPQASSFVNDVVPILTRAGCNAGACHGALAGKGGLKLSLRGYDPQADHFALTRQVLARRIDGQNPVKSLLLTKATRSIPHGGGTRFETDSVHYAVLLKWIQSGAPGPKSDERTLTKLETIPAKTSAKPNNEIQLRVRATYSDGKTADVTHLSKFLSSEETVANIDEDGKIRVTNPGETGISALFAGKVATSTITVPFAHNVKPEVFEKSPRNNFIDEHILRKLQLLNIPPSAQASDAEFIRRAFLDTCGIVPKPAEVQAFLADASPTKRAMLTEKLLERPEFVDYWTHQWSDLLLVSSRKLSQQSMWGFYRAIRSSVAENQPWDKFAREILTASGSTISNGGASYFLLHKDVADLAESTAVTFMGTSITCARCHNHPLEKWTQDQYWALANLFSQVGLKNGDRAGETIVQSLPQGDSLHLRKGFAMPPTPLDGKPLALDSATDRRAYFAQWLTEPNNPFFAKAIVNRVWKNFMGRGLVEAVDDLRDTNPATNPELLDALTQEFIKNKFDMKKLMKQILTSAAYQRSSVPVPENQADDRFYSRYLPRRLSAEVILDAYSDITSVPTDFNTLQIGASGGTAKTASFPAGTRAMQLPDSLLVSRFLDVFGRAERTVTCACEVTRDSTVTQALHMSNGQTLNEKLRQPTSIVNTWQKAKTTNAEIVNQLFMLALARRPTATESKKFLTELDAAGKINAKAHQEAIEDATWAVLSGKEFLFNR